VSRYRFIQAEQAKYPVTILCRVLHIARSGYYAWARRRVSARATADRALTDQITLIHERSRHTYGAPRVHAALRAAGLASCHRRRRARSTIPDPARVPAPNLVARDFAASGPDRLWCGDSTYIATWEGWLYLAVLLDAHARRVVGWAMADHLRAELALDALAMALGSRRPAAGLIHHTDRGGQYAAIAYQEALAAREITASMSRAGDCYDNAMAERFFATLEAELVDTRPWPTRQTARQAIFEWLEVFYNWQRSHSALGYQTPAAFEQELAKEVRAA